MIQINYEVNEQGGIFKMFDGEVQVGEMTFVQVDAQTIKIDHTETFKGHEGKGYARQLVNYGIDYAREHQLKIIPECSYAKKVIEGDEANKDVLA